MSAAIASMDRATHEPGPFVAAALTSKMPFGTLGATWLQIARPGRSFSADDNGLTEWLMAATPGIFSAIGVPILSGRAFDARDDASADQVIVMSEHAARDVFGTAAAVGRTIHYSADLTGDAVEGTMRVVGVSRDTDVWQFFDRHFGAVFVPLAQWHLRRLYLVARTAGNPSLTIPALQAIARRANPDLVLQAPGTGVSALAPRYAWAGIGATLSAGLATLALVLAMSGLYGALSHLVARRRREIGVRMALGAEGSQIRSLVRRDGLRPVLAGLVLGCGVGVLGRQIVIATLDVNASLPPWERSGGPTAVDPIAFALTAILLAVAALIACDLPARRASRVDPNVALRDV